MLTSMRKKRRTGFKFLTLKRDAVKGRLQQDLPAGQCMIKANRSNPKIRHAVPIPGCPPALEDLVNVLKENGVEIDMEDYLRYRKHLTERYKSKPQFDPKDLFKQGGFRMEVKRVGIVGMGTMGCQIGIVCASAGFQTPMVDV
jgi:hypothetical protein